jgi:hypothetical protein
MNDRLRAWKIYGFWAVWVGVAFFAVYPTCNWLTSRRTRLFDFYVAPELALPFVPSFIWAYLSMYALFLTPPLFLDAPRLRALGRQLVAATIFSGLVFLILPARLGFARVVPSDSFYRAVYSRLFAIDEPHNLVPSMHVVFSALIALSVADCAAPGIVRTFFFVWLGLIVASTVLVHQHHLIDPAAGLLVAAAFRHWIKPGETHA